jgi:hypothetical protein
LKRFVVAPGAPDLLGAPDRLVEGVARPKPRRKVETNVVTLSACSTSWFSRLFNFRDHGLYRVESAVWQRVDGGQEVIISVVPLCLPSQVLFAGRKLSAAKIPSHILALCHGQPAVL